jgi:dipeptidyl aminopeptidase/acylaminoacyl peptidase
VKATDLGLLTSVSSPTIAPDGSRVVVGVSHPDLDADATVGQLWSVQLDGSQPHRITRGFRDASPAFSPDGEAIAFLRSGPGAPPQLHVMPAGGGEPIALTDAKLGVSDIRWSGDSTRIVYLANVPEQGRHGTVEGITAGAEPARRITGLDYKANGRGYTADQRSHVFVVEVPALDAEPVYPPAPNPDGSKPDSSPLPVPVQLTHGDYDDTSPRFMGERVAFLSARHDARDSTLTNQLWVVGADGEPEALSELGTVGIDSFEVADEGTVYLVGQELGSSGLDFVARNSSLYRLDGAALTVLTDPETVDLTEGQLVVAGNTPLLPNRSRGRVQLLEWRGEGDLRPLTEGDIEVLGQAASGDLVVVTYASPETFGDVALLENGALRKLTDFSAALRAAGIVAPTELTVTARDGNPVHGWVVRPAGEGSHPTLLMIHGGPFADYAVHLFDEVQVYVDAGYAVVFCNPRGSAGYGRAHGRAIRQAMGTVDLHDVLDFFDGALDTFVDLDRDRIGILGGSYGGYLTAWAIAHDHRFRAAVVERGYLDPTAFVGSSDIGWFFPLEYNGTDLDAVRAQSPQAVAHQVTTPTLVIHSQDDLRCPIGQAETWYATVRLAGTAAELLVFPGENHELSRSGRPRHRLQRFEAILEWMGRYL